VIARPAPAVLSVRRIERAEVELTDDVEHEPGEMSVGEPVRDRRWHEIELLAFDFSKVDCHVSIV
jgi:hypothetical protein